MVDRGKGRAPLRGGTSEPPVSDEFERPRPTTALGLGPAKKEALQQQQEEQLPPPIETIEPVPEDFAQRLGLEDNDAPLPRDTAILNLDVVWRSSEDQHGRAPTPDDREDEEDDLDDSLLGPGPLPPDDLPEESDAPPSPPPEASKPKAIEPAGNLPPPAATPDPVVIPPPPRVATLSDPRGKSTDDRGARPAGVDAVVPTLVGLFGMIAGYILASLLLGAC
jgi:hypothetical protein